MAAVCVINHNTHKTHHNTISNNQLLKQLHSTNTENIILKQKITTLTSLCHHHKSQYQHIKAKLQIEYNQQIDEYSIQIDQLLEQVQNQTNTMKELQTKLTNSQQKSVNKSILHNKQIKSLEHQMEDSKKQINQFQQNNVSYLQEIYTLRNELLNKDDHIGKLKTRLLSAYDQYIPNYNSYTPTPTVRIQSVRMSISTGSPELSSNNLKYFNIHDISPVPSLNKTNNSYNHGHIMRRSNNKKYIKRKSDYNVIKWSDTIHNVIPSKIHVNDDEYLDDILSDKRESISINTHPNMPILNSLHSNNFGMSSNPITPFTLSQRNSNTKSALNSVNVTPTSQSSNSLQSVNSSTCYIKNSETPMSPDVGINENEKNYM